MAKKFKAVAEAMNKSHCIPGIMISTHNNSTCDMCFGWHAHAALPIGEFEKLANSIRLG